MYSSKGTPYWRPNETAMAKLFIKAFTNSPSLLVSMNISPIFPSSYSPVCKYTLWSPMVAFCIYPFLLSGILNLLPFFSFLLKIWVTEFLIVSFFEKSSLDTKLTLLVFCTSLFLGSRLFVFLLSSLTSSISKLPSSLFSKFLSSFSFISSR